MHLVRACCDNQVHVKRVECLNLWLKNVGLVIWTWLETFVKSTSITQTLLHFSSIDNDIKTDFTVSCSQSQHLTSVSCSSFSEFSCPWFGPWFGRSAGCQGQHPRNEKPNSQCFASSKKNRILVAAYNISPRQAIKEENRKIKHVWFFNIEKLTSPSYL